VKRFCRTTDPCSLPRKKPRPTLQLLSENHSFVIRRGQVLLEQSTDRWRGMWILPRLAGLPSRRDLIHRSAFPFTHHRITLTVYPAANRRKGSGGGERWFALPDLPSIPIPSPHRRALNDILASHLAS
jgi:A/G-specific adenine glycosylase